MEELRYDLLYELYELFLKRNHCLDSFINQSRFKSLYAYVSRNKQNPYGLVQKGFKWLNSVEGFTYWSALDSKWQRLIDDLIGE